MIREGIDRILELARPETVQIGGRTYWKSGAPVLEPEIKPLAVHTLSGLVDYVKSQICELPDSYAIHVEDHRNVKIVLWARGPFLQRDVPAHASFSFLEAGFPFGQYLDVEDFIINVQMHMVPDDTRAELLRLVGNLKEEAVRTLADDGVTQVAATRSGIAGAANTIIPNPVVLRPYRTFCEVEQPQSAFVFRLKKSSAGNPPTAALFSADGGMWKLRAIQNILDWLRDKVPCPIIA